MSIRKQEDPRALRSKRMFKQAALSLLIEEPSSQLTVQKLADRAELNRATFYLHYEDIKDLLQQITNEIFDELSIKIEPLVQSQVIDNREQLTLFLDYIYENRRYLFVLFEQKNFEDQLFSLIKNLIKTRRDRKGADLPDDIVSLEVLTSSIVGIILWWIKDGMQFSSEFLATQITLIYRRSPIT